MGERLHEAWVPNLSSLYDEVTTLRSEVHTLAESHTNIISPVIPPILQLLPTPLTLTYDLFIDDDEPQTTKTKKKWEHTNKNGSSDEFEWDLKKAFTNFDI